ncbi:MAG: hypothetical protein H6R17_2641 [Proteobacteria bacterium]|nr:hypothetical protein [Pseudomonadota bacterium]
MNRPRNHRHAEARRWLDYPENVRKIYFSVWIGCAILLLLELMIDKHAETTAEHWFGFHGFFGLIACIALVLAAKLLRRIISRPENYYDHH